MRLGVLLRNECIKTLKRLAFWVTYASFTAIMTMGFVDDLRRARRDPERPFSLPDSWSRILADNNEVALIFGSVILLLLISSEFSWRTARQNVIDGLSKEQFFLSKLLLLPMVGLLFVATKTVIGATFSLFATDFSTGETLVRGVHVSALGGFALASLGYGSLALFSALAVRNSGPALALWFFYVALIENLIANGLVAISEGLEPVVRHLPISTFNQLFEFIQHDPAALRRAVQNAIENERQIPEIWDMGTLLLASTLWIAVFVGVSFVWFRKRDL
jgi:ABC-type transport system involved in multi-copper enzyme maturation permease subunit